MSSGQVALIVSDDAATRAALSRALEGGGWTLLEAAGPGETEAALGRAAVDAVVLAPGSPAAAQNLLHLLQERAADLPVVAASPVTLELARKLVAPKGPMPVNARDDALHIAIATAAGMEYLLTWNCSHIANAEVKRIVVRLTHEIGYECPEICTPEELMGM